MTHSQEETNTLSKENESEYMKDVIADLMQTSDINKVFPHGYRFVEVLKNLDNNFDTLIFASSFRDYFAYDYDPLVVTSCFSLRDVIHPERVYEVRRKEKVVYEYLPKNK